MILFLILIGIAAGTTAASIALLSGAGLVAAFVAYTAFGIAAVVAAALLANLTPNARLSPLGESSAPALRR